jgi:hypothetical protein
MNQKVTFEEVTTYGICDIPHPSNRLKFSGLDVPSLIQHVVSYVDIFHGTKYHCCRDFLCDWIGEGNCLKQL